MAGQNTSNPNPVLSSASERRLDQLKAEANAARAAADLASVLAANAYEEFAIAQIARGDLNKDGFLSADEARKTFNLQLTRNATEASSETNLAFFDRQQFIQMTARSLSLTPERADKLIAEIFPKGVAAIMLSDECKARPELGCSFNKKSGMVEFSGSMPKDRT